MKTVILGIFSRCFVVSRNNGETIGRNVGQRSLFILSDTKTCLQANENNSVDRKKLMM